MDQNRPTLQTETELSNMATTENVKKTNENITKVTSTKLKFPLLESSNSDDDVILVAPWKIYEQRPSYLSRTLNRHSGNASPGSKLNVLMESVNPDSQLNGKMDHFCELWILKCKRDVDIDIFLTKLDCQYSLLQVNLVERKVFRDSIEIPMLVFINNKSDTIETLKNNLKMVREAGWNEKKFSFEIDYGPAIESWASNVLKRDFICMGGRFCITNAASFNHVLDWKNLLSCFICGPCGLMAGAAYRFGRKVRYLESILTPKHDVMVVGGTSVDSDDQRDALMSLIKWMSEELPPKKSVTIRDSPVHQQEQEKQEPADDNETELVTESRASDHSMPAVDSDSTFKGRYKFDPLSYPKLMNFLASDKATNKSKSSRDPKGRVSSPRKSPIRKNDMTTTNNNRRTSITVKAAIGETNV